MERGSSVFIDPYSGEGWIQSLEPGFHFIVASIKWISNSDFVTIFVFMPSLIAIFTCLAAFNIGEEFGLEAAFLVSFVPTTCRILGPSFFLPVTIGLLLILFIIWLCKRRILFLIPLFVFCAFLVHPPSGLACIIVSLIYFALLLLEKELRLFILGMILTLAPIGIVLLLSTRWYSSLQRVVDAFLGGRYFLDLDLPKVLVSIEHLGILGILSIVGVYFSFAKGKSIHRLLSLSGLTFISIIVLYDRLGYGIPLMYERSFLYLFLIITLLAGYGIKEVSKIKGKGITSLIICILLGSIVVPAHLSIHYYKIIDEEEFQTFIWIRDNIEKFRDANHSYNRCAVSPFKASVFSAVTGLYIVSSTMHPLYGYTLGEKMETFLEEGCVDVEFLKKHKISVVYGECKNENLTMIYPNVYLYPGL
jgi:hypothetical protein